MFSLIHQTRHLLQGEIIQRMYPDEELTNLNDDLDLEETKTENFISVGLSYGSVVSPKHFKQTGCSCSIAACYGWVIDPY